MTAIEPYEKDGKWWIDKDPDDKLYYVANVIDALTDGGTSAVSFEVITKGVIALEQGKPQGERGGLLVVKLDSMGPEGTDSYCKFRVTCANTEQFDRTIWFNRVEN